MASAKGILNACGAVEIPPYLPVRKLGSTIVNRNIFPVGVVDEDTGQFYLRFGSLMCPFRPA
jgi:hypothetical protein